MRDPFAHLLRGTLKLVGRPRACAMEAGLEVGDVRIRGPRRENRNHTIWFV